MRYAWVLNGGVVRMQEFVEHPPALPSSKGVWLPVVRRDDPEYDGRLQECVEEVIVAEAEVVIARSLHDKPLAEVRAALVAQLKDEVQELILAAAPDYKQRNAALGIYTPEEAEAIRSVIRTHRDACNATEAAILAAETGHEALAAFIWRRFWPEPLLGASESLVAGSDE
ncbi:MAG: hypothetical protein HQM00_01775 [Magnetococcales bacterium]|nr:hypothetical protein [Magnetococcales bacterium]